MIAHDMIAGFDDGVTALVILIPNSMSPVPAGAAEAGSFCVLGYLSHWCLADRAQVTAKNFMSASPLSL